MTAILQTGEDEEAPTSVRCDLDSDHLTLHAIVHDGIVLLEWGMDDFGEGEITGGIFRPLFWNQA